MTVSLRPRVARSVADALSLVRRARSRYQAILPAVEKIISDVRERGDDALHEYLASFHGVKGVPLRVGEAEFRKALSSVSGESLEAVREAARRVEAVSYKMKPSTAVVELEGVTVTVKFQPVESVGGYAPRSEAAYPSTVVMLAVPAKVAGVERFALASPPDGRGEVHPLILAAASVAGVDEVYRLGGAYAAAALALGTESVPRVDMLVGPGGGWFTAAKRLLHGEVGIDMLAGPTELLVIADGSVDARLVAADIAAQAEHSSDTLLVLATTNEGYAERVINELETLAAELPTGETIASSINSNGLVAVLSSDKDVVELANRVAPEHVYIAMDGDAAREVAEKLRSFGAATIGPWTPPALADYNAGANHVLPTDGWARFRGGFSVLDYLKPQYIVEATLQGFTSTCLAAIRLAEEENLPAHAYSIKMRGCRGANR